MYWEEGIETIERDKLEAVQLERFKENIKRAKKSIYYNELFREVGQDNRQKKGIMNMAHRDAGNYSAKHASDRKLNKEIAQAIEKKALKGEIACRDTEGIAIELNVPMGEVGIATDLMEIRISKCQLGLFGYGPGKKAIKPVKTIPSGLEKAIRSALVNGQLPCIVSWEVAQEFNISRMDVSSACEALEIKIKPCQLGAF